jgi:hypothetical protein
MSRWSDLYASLARRDAADSADTSSPQVSAESAPSTDQSSELSAPAGVVSAESASSSVNALNPALRRWAEGYLAIRAMDAPAGFSLREWQRMQNAVGTFLNRWGKIASAFGYTDLDLFACDPRKPAERIDCKGLLLLLDRMEIVAIDADGAVLRTRTGAAQRWRRRPLPAHAVPIWQLMPP